MTTIQIFALAVGLIKQLINRWSLAGEIWYGHKSHMYSHIMYKVMFVRQKLQKWRLCRSFGLIPDKFNIQSKVNFSLYLTN
jgi:hypothetical protein